jgi:endonuclease/exonuclease/phosphatase (EEP) superfamily protein YafD
MGAFMRWLSAALLALLTVMALLGGHVRAFDFYGQLQAQVLLAAVILALVALLLRQWGMLLAECACVAALGLSLYPWLAPPPRVMAVAETPVLRLAWGNLRNWSTTGAAVQRLLESEAPDIAVLTELSEHHRAAVMAAPGYVFRSRFPAGSAFDVMLMSRRRPVELRFDYQQGADLPVMTARFCPDAGGTGCLALVALHAPRPPLLAGALGAPAQRRDAMLDLAAGIARRRLAGGDHVLLLGDLNATPYSASFRAVLAASGLADSARVPAEQPTRARPTWLSAWPGLGLAIDHALVSPGIRIVERRLGPDIGSDHFPLVLHLRLPAAP